MSNIHATSFSTIAEFNSSFPKSETLPRANTSETPDEFDLPWTNDPDWYCSPEDLDVNERDCF